MLRPSLIAGIVLALALPLAAQSQDNSSQQQQTPPAPTNKSAQQKKDQPKDQPKKSTAQDNPFPEAQSEAAAHQSQQQQNPNAAPDAPQPQSAPKAGSPDKPAGPNSFPEAQSEKAARDAQQTDKDQPGSAPSSDEPSYSSSRVKGLDMPTTDETPPANLSPSPLPFDTKRAKKDANIGDYYMESGNWKGAYDRFLEANRSDPGNAEAVFGLAESARHLHLDDEARRNYRLYLSALPNGPHAKEIHKALKQMGAEP